jgi:hypothetical protein
METIEDIRISEQQAQSMAIAIFFEIRQYCDEHQSDFKRFLLWYKKKGGGDDDDTCKLRIHKSR